MTDNDGLFWVPLLEAARRLGKSTDAVRSMIRRDKLPTRKGNDGRVLIGVPTAEGQAADGLATAGDQAGDGHATAELMQEIMELRERLARAESEREAARSTAQAEVAATGQVLAEVRAQIAREIARGDTLAAELAEARRPWWRRWRR